MSKTIGTISKQKKISTQKVNIEKSFPLDRNADSLATSQFQHLACQALTMQKSNKATTIMLTSALKKEGTSTAAVNLAIALADYGGLKTLLVDTNINSNKLSKLFGIHADGILDIENISNNGHIEEFLFPTEIANLKLLSCLIKGSVIQKAQELFEVLSSKLKDKFDFIIFDSAPVIESNLTLTPHLASKVDGVIMVVRANKTRYEVALKAKQELLKFNANLIGAILSRRTFEIPDILYRLL